MHFMSPDHPTPTLITPEGGGVRGLIGDLLIQIPTLS